MSITEQINEGHFFYFSQNRIHKPIPISGHEINKVDLNRYKQYIKILYKRL